jgi:hypothetical protein
MRDAGIDLGQHVDGVMDEHLAIAGELDAVAIALQQLGAEIAFEVAQAIGDRRLRHVQPFRRA